MIRIETVNWHEYKQTLKNIRQIVFINEQNVPEELEWDGLDASSTHFLAKLNNSAVACARLTPNGQLGRMAVLKDHRNNGIGSKLLEYILRYAKDQQIDNLFLHAQTKAIKFYQRHGFVTEGQIFLDANIEHITMTKQL